MVRSPWAYHLDRDEYCRFLDDLGTRLPVDNPPAVLRWNTDKRYLADLAAAGLPITPTWFVAPGEPMTPDRLLAALADTTAAAGIRFSPDDDIVVKPAVFAGSRNTARHPGGAHRAIARHVAELHAAGQVVMVQPYLRSVDDIGETAVALIDGQISHTLRKGPLLQAGAPPVKGLFAVEDMSPREPSPAQLAVVHRLVDALTARFAGALGGRPLLYARVDVIEDDDGRPLLLEVELNEPSLFHDHAPGSAERFASAILRRHQETALRR